MIAAQDPLARAIPMYIWAMVIGLNTFYTHNIKEEKDMNLRGGMGDTGKSCRGGADMIKIHCTCV